MQLQKALLITVTAVLSMNITVAFAESSMTPPVATSLCEIAKEKKEFTGKLVSVEGEVSKIADFNKLYLVDNECPNSEFALRFDAPAGGGDNFSALYDYLYYSKREEALGKVIHCRCTGRVRYIRQKLMGYVVSSPTIYVAKIEKVWLSN